MFETMQLKALFPHVQPGVEVASTEHVEQIVYVQPSGYMLKVSRHFENTVHYG